MIVLLHATPFLMVMPVSAYTKFRSMIGQLKQQPTGPKMAESFFYIFHDQKTAHEEGEEGEDLFVAALGKRTVSMMMSLSTKCKLKNIILFHLIT